MTSVQLATHAPVEVLHPALNRTDFTAKTAEIEELFRTAFIPTDRASQYFKWLDELRLVKQCGRVIGPRDTGKSRSSLYYREEDYKRVSCVKAWSNSSSKRLFSQILKDINHAAPEGKQQDLRPRLAGCIEPFGIELIIIDNADNLQKEAFLDLKQLHEESGVPVALVGGCELDSILNLYDLLSTFPSLFEFDRLEEDDFKKTLRTIEFEILALPKESNLEGDLFEILASNTGARMGSLIKILTKAVLHSLKNGHGKVDPGIFLNIAERYGKKHLPRQEKVVS
ncbi:MULTISPECIES: AAA family ATPase [Cyanophyceae]|uniref:AAA family ATPase n=1 Tax=Cyanophyceae TaxID=3028117 RepID=UPI0016823643|nr:MULTISPECIES: AAA family ATPase [Cyanophyceae]MBD1918447.1 ATP-binding protein [Phormidium sp. FACHB-77]MBD2031336.1 ATP-binding protein [Phormidium sp. FACHB-322]MBD2049456.1 ATP-binding protein [Leptolyngbya sp. FACHB-60]